MQSPMRDLSTDAALHVLQIMYQRAESSVAENLSFWEFMQRTLLLFTWERFIIYLFDYFSAVDNSQSELAWHREASARKNKQ